MGLIPHSYTLIPDSYTLKGSVSRPVLGSPVLSPDLHVSLHLIPLSQHLIPLSQHLIPLSQAQQVHSHLLTALHYI